MSQCIKMMNRRDRAQPVDDSRRGSIISAAAEVMVYVIVEEKLTFVYLL